MHLLKYLHSNEIPFMSKELHVAIMKRSRLRNKFLREKNQANRDNYKIQHNLCKKRFRKKRHILAILIQKESRIIETFGKQLFLSLKGKPSKSENIVINEVDKSISDEKYLTTFFQMLCPT